MKSSLLAIFLLALYSALVNRHHRIARRLRPNPNLKKYTEADLQKACH
jgi:hypothetical protein